MSKIKLSKPEFCFSVRAWIVVGMQGSKKVFGEGTTPAAATEAATKRLR